MNSQELKQQNNNNLKFSFLILIYIFSRIVSYSLGIYPTEIHLLQMMQLVSAELLRDQYFETLYYLHYQPPIWNAIYGILIKIVGVDSFLLSKLLHIFNIFISLMIIYIFFLICNFFKLKKKEILIIYLVYFIFSLGFLFYESYHHYSHLTVYLFSLLVYFFLKFGETEQFKYELYLYFVAAFLVFTWTAFSHPIFIFTIFFGICLIKYKKNFIRSFVIFLIFVFISLSLSIKNKIEFDIFANSSWIGLQVAQVVEAYGIQYPLCDFDRSSLRVYENKYKEENPNHNVDAPYLTGPLSKYNNIGYVYKTKKCIKIGIDHFKTNPLYFLNQFKFKFISTHGHFVFDHGHLPNNWDKHFSFFDELKKNKFQNSIKVRSLQLYYVLIYILFFIMLLKSLLNIKDNSSKITKSISAIFLVYLWLIFVIHVAAGFEQERMRHTGHFLHIIFAIIILKHKFNFKSIYKSYLLN